MNELSNNHGFAWRPDGDFRIKRVCVQCQEEETVHALQNIVAVNAAVAASRPSWCDEHHCDCPCHDEGAAEWWFAPLTALIILGLLGAVVWFMIAMIDWMSSSQTLVQVIVGEFHWLRELMGRIW